MGTGEGEILCCVGGTPSTQNDPNSVIFINLASQYFKCFYAFMNTLLLFLFKGTTDFGGGRVGYLQRGHRYN